MDVVRAAWTAAGTPGVVDGEVGICARCSSTGPSVASRTAVSRTFTGMDCWDRPAGDRLCPACAWAYGTPALRAGAHLVGAGPVALTPLERVQGADVLTCGPLTGDQALVVPLRPGRKHLLPSAAWGHVRLDDVTISWSRSDAARLATARRLRTLGFGTAMLAAAAPAFGVLRRLPRSQWQSVMDAWHQLDPWRATDSPWMHLALHITTPTQEPRMRVPFVTVLAVDEELSHLAVVSPAIAGTGPGLLPPATLCGSPIVRSCPDEPADVGCPRCLARCGAYLHLPAYRTLAEQVTR